MHTHIYKLKYVARNALLLMFLRSILQTKLQATGREGALIARKRIIPSILQYLTYCVVCNKHVFFFILKKTFSYRQRDMYAMANSSFHSRIPLDSRSFSMQTKRISAFSQPHIFATHLRQLYLYSNNMHMAFIHTNFS